MIWPVSGYLFMIISKDTISHVPIKHMPFLKDPFFSTTTMDDDLQGQDESVRIAVRALGDMRNSAQQPRPDREFFSRRYLTEI